MTNDELDYQIVDKPLNITTNKWKQLFGLLSFDRAVRFNFDSELSAKRRGNLICVSLRRRPGVDYTPHYRIIPDGERFILYVWKEKRREENVTRSVG